MKKEKVMWEQFWDRCMVHEEDVFADFGSAVGQQCRKVMHEQDALESGGQLCSLDNHGNSRLEVNSKLKTYMQGHELILLILYLLLILAHSSVN